MITRVCLATFLYAIFYSIAIAETSPSQALAQTTSTASTQNSSIQNGERLSQWLLNHQQENGMNNLGQSNNAYPLGMAWETPKEISAQELEKQKLLDSFAKIPFPEDDPKAQRAKKAFSKLIQSLKPTGRVSLPSVNPYFLEANPKLDPILQSNDQIISSATPSTVTIIRSNGTLCNVRYRPNVEARFYVSACQSRSLDNEYDSDWAWVVEPDGTIHTVSVASWNSAKQVLPAPGSWIWSPPRWSKWSNSTGEEFSNDLTRMLAAQGPSGLANSLDNANSTRASLPSVSPSELYSISRDLPISANIWGETGLLQTPTARTAPAGTGALTFGWFNPYANVNLFFSPLDEVEFVMRYTNMNNVVYAASNGSQSNKDKSVGLKVNLIKENYYLPSISVGARDMLGTGLFSGEYLVANKRHDNFDFSLGMGWGQLGTRNNVTNPFVTAFGQNFATRSAGTSNQGGTPTGQFFHGPAALFGGVQYHTPLDNLVLKLEVDGNNYQKLPYGETLPIKTIFNYGATYQTKNADFTLGLMGNSQVMFTVSLHERLDLLNTPKLAEAKPIPVALKPIGNYDPQLTDNTISPQATLPENNKAATKTVNSYTPKASVVEPIKKSLANLSQKSDIDQTQATSQNTSIAATSNGNQTPQPADNQGSGIAVRQNITTTYNSTLLDFESQSQWKVKGLQVIGNTWTVHLLDASGVFIRSRLNRGIAVLHRDAPSNIDTFEIQFYNWGMLVSEYKIDRKQWMLSQTQLLPPSQRRASITTESTGYLPADGGNPFFERTNSLSLPSAFARHPSSEDRSTNHQSNKADSAPTVDELEHQRLNTNLGISYAQVVGSPSAAFLFAIGVKGDAIYKFRENTWLSGTVNTRVIDNFGKYTYQPPPTGLQPVRTDIRQYMTQSIATMPNLQITNTGKISDNQFVSAYAGYLELMFAGAGGEYLWRPVNSKIALGANINQVWQRQFNVWTSLQNYNVTTGHATAYWDTGVQDILVKLSYGKYLAGDIGGTLDLSRVFQNGVKVGAYATRTNVNYSQFGEGSFDKGVYISIPFDAFFARHSDSSANMLFTPLIRDGGAMLYRKYQLYDMTRTRDSRALTAGPN